MGEGGALGGWSLVQANGVRNSQGAEVHQRQGPIFESWLYFRSRECMITIDLLLALPLLAPGPEADI